MTECIQQVKGCAGFTLSLITTGRKYISYKYVMSCSHLSRHDYWSLKLLQGLHLHFCMQQNAKINWIWLLKVLVHRLQKDFAKVPKSPHASIHPPSRAQWQSAVWQPKNSVCCITLLMLLKWPQHFSAGGEVKQDHLLLFLEKLLAWFTHRPRPFVSHSQCKTHVQQDIKNTSCACVIWLICSGYNRKWCLRNCLQAFFSFLWRIFPAMNLYVLEKKMWKDK